MGSVAAAGFNTTYDTPKFRLIFTLEKEAAVLKNVDGEDNMVKTASKTTFYQKIGSIYFNQYFHYFRKQRWRYLHRWRYLILLGAEFNFGSTCL